MRIIEHQSTIALEGELYVVCKKSLDDLLKKYNIPEYEFENLKPADMYEFEDEYVRIDKTIAVNKEGLPFEVYVVGNHDSSLVRFLKGNEDSFREFCKKHPKFHDSIQFGDETHEIIVHDYCCYTLAKVNRFNPQLDEALGIGEQK
jgi:hypothetical protein